MRKINTNFYLIIMFLIVALTITSSSSYLTDNDNISIPITIGEVRVSPRISFENNQVLIPASEVEIVSGVFKNGVYLVNISDGSSPQFIEKLRIYFDVFSNVNTYIRIKLVEQLTLTRVSTSGEITELTILMEDPMDFLYETSWYDNREIDDYFYYMNKVKYVNESTPLSIGLITEYYSDKYFVSRPLGYSLQIGVQIQAVQAELGPQKNWGLASAPWGGAW